MDPGQLRVAELQSALRARGLDARGKKQELVDRLREALRADETAGVEPNVVVSEPDKGPELGAVEESLLRGGNVGEAAQRAGLSGASELASDGVGEILQVEYNADASTGKPTDAPSLPVAEAEELAAPSSSTRQEASDAPAEAKEVLSVADDGRTRHVRIDRMQRPLHTRQFLDWLGERLGRAVDPNSIWLAPMKTHCYISFESVEQAAACVSRVSGQRFKENPSILQASFSTVSAREAPAFEATQGARKVEVPPPSLPPAARSEVRAPAAEEKLTQVVRKPIQLAKRMMERALSAAVSLPRPPMSSIQSVEKGFLTSRFLERRQSGDTADDAAPLVPIEEVEESKAVPRKRDSADLEEGAARHEEFIRRLDGKFRKTATKPHLYWLPVSDDIVAKRRESIRRSRAAAQS